MDEILAVVKNLGFSYSDALKIPTYQRRYMLFKNKEVHEEQLEEIENKRSNNSKGKRTFSGDTLKNKLKNNEIPNQ